MDNLSYGFNPYINEDSKILILGSFPSVISRKNGFYYGNPQNRFWKIIAEIFNEDLPSTIEQKKQLCKKHKLALWDIIIESNVKGSSDKKVNESSFKIADISQLLQSYKISKIICNGNLAFSLFIKNFGTNYNVIKLPSTSPANVKFNKNLWQKALIKD